MTKISWRAARVNAELTQDQVCKELGIQRRTIINWESYQTEPKFSTAVRLATLYNISLEEIRESKEEKDERPFNI